MDDALALGVLTSGGDAPGMNAAVRAVVRTALDRGAQVYAVREGYQGLVGGGESIAPLAWEDVGGILQRGGTVIGTARCDAFRARAGRRRAAMHLVQRGIDRLVVIGGDGSLVGADTLRAEWPGLLAELVDAGELDPGAARRCDALTIAGLVGSIDNDMQGTDLTIGAVSALHRITEAIDALHSTASSHQRAFVVEVMGRNCGWLAVMGALAGAADWVLVPESPPDVEDWREVLCERLAAGRRAGHRDSIVVLAEGAMDRRGAPIRAEDVRLALEARLREGVRVTILGHVQRGGTPAALDRNMGSILGHAAVEEVLAPEKRGQAVVIGVEENRVVRRPLVECVERTRRAAEALARRDFDEVMSLRGEGFREAFRTMRTVARALPRAPAAGRRRVRLGVLHAGAPAPGMNAAVRVAVRLGLDKGHEVLGVRHGVRGLVEDRVEAMSWMGVRGWVGLGGAELGTNRRTVERRDLHAVARTLERHEIGALLWIGGWEAYESALFLHEHEDEFPALGIPTVLVPATIDNNLPGSESSVGADTALNSIARAVDAIKQSAVASQRAFVVEVMGRYCGYLALMSGLATGAERVYLHEEGVTLADLSGDVARLIEGFEHGKRVGLAIRNEYANDLYDTDFVAALFEEEGGDLFDVRKAILGHLQQGGDPSPWDRILATRLATRALELLDAWVQAGEARAQVLGVVRGSLQAQDLRDFPRHVDRTWRRALDPWWMGLREVARVLSQPGPRAG